jgi:Thrombospondin type 3 repeat
VIRLCTLLALAISLAAAGVAAAHPEPGDRDGDLVANAQDSCPDTWNPRQEDADGDGVGDPCEVDGDGDGLQDFRDKCPDLRSINVDTDNDQVGDECDPDDDNDNRADAHDNCRFQYNPDQVDDDRDGRGRECDPSDAAVGAPPASPGVALQAGSNVAVVRAPRLRVAVARRQRLRAVGRTLIVRVRCSEACAIAADLVLSARTARRVGLARGRGSVVVGRGAQRMAGATRSYVFVDLPRTVARRLRRRARVPALLRVVAEDGAGNRRTATRRLELRR